MMLLSLKRIFIKELFETIEEIIDYCEDKIIKDLKIFKDIDFNSSDNHKRVLNEYLKDNYEKYFDLYEENLQEKLDIEIMFINVK